MVRYPRLGTLTVLSFTQAHVYDAPFCNISRDNCAIPLSYGSWGPIFSPFLRRSARAPTIKTIRGTMAIKGIFDNSKGRPFPSRGPPFPSRGPLFPSRGHRSSSLLGPRQDRGKKLSRAYFFPAANRCLTGPSGLLRESETTIEIKFAFFREGGGQGGQRGKLSKTLFFVGNATTIKL